MSWTHFSEREMRLCHSWRNGAESIPACTQDEEVDEFRRWVGHIAGSSRAWMFKDG